MNSAHDEVFALLDEYAGGPTPLPPSRDVIAAGTRQRHRRQAALGGGALALAAIVTVGSVLVASGTGTSKQHVATGKPLDQPTASQLAHGRWIKIPKAPIGLCNPQTVSDGTGLLVLESGISAPHLEDCLRGMARYDSASNTWTTLATPPPPTSFKSPPAIAWGGGQLATVGASGETLLWSASTDTWTQVARLPASKSSATDRGFTSLSWSGSSFDAVRLDQRGAEIYSLNSAGQWSKLSTLSAPHDQRVLDAAATTEGGSLYLVASIANIARNNTPSTDGDYSSLFRLTGGQWHQVSLPGAELPLSELVQSTVNGRLLVSGTGCPATGIPCTIVEGITTIVRLNPVAAAIDIKPSPTLPMPLPDGVTSGGQVIYASYAAGTGPTGIPVSKPPTGEVYSFTTGQWLRVPRNPEVQGPAATATWTSGGVVIFGAISGDWLLKPAKP
jgi:hypothetical protein